MPPKKMKRKAASDTSSVAKKKRKESAIEIPDKYVMQEAKEFLDSMQIPKTRPPSAKSVLQLLVASLLLSARMRENISTRTFLLLKDRYSGCDFKSLSAATWSDLRDVLQPILRILK